MVKQGVVPSQEIREWIHSKAITADTEIQEGQIQPASLDLRVNAEIYTLQGVFRPFDKIENYLSNSKFVREKKEIPSSGLILEKGITYLIKLQEHVKLDSIVHATFNPKSSTGRVDLSTKIIGDKQPVFDTLPTGFEGSLYCLATPLSFPIRIREGDSLSQMRFMVGNPELDALEIRNLHQRLPLIYDEQEKPADISSLHIHNSKLFTGIDLEADVKAYVSRKDSSEVLDLQKRDHNMEDFFREIRRNENTLSITPGDFYLLASLERFALPAIEPTGNSQGEAYSATMIPVDANYGDLRTHYAGFFDPGWGSGRNQEKKGKPGTLEVRGMDAPHIVLHSQYLCGFAIEKMRAYPDKIYGDGSNYSTEYRGPQLSKHFKNFKK